MKKLLTILFASLFIFNLNVHNATASSVLVVYFSQPETSDPNNMTRDEANSVVVIDNQVLGNTQYIATLIQKATNADIFRIEAKIPYSTDHKTLIDVATKEKESQARPELATNLTNIDQYNTIFLGYPNWNGDMPMILYSFLENTDLSNKTIIPFNTHGGSGFSNSINTITQLQPNATVIQDGFSVSRSKVDKSSDDLHAWLKSLKIKMLE